MRILNNDNPELFVHIYYARAHIVNCLPMMKLHAQKPSSKQLMMASVYNFLQHYPAPLRPAALKISGITPSLPMAIM
jgi:hypothetical protein